MKSIGLRRQCRRWKTQNKKKIKMHHFSDASVQGYSQCIYLCLEDEAHNVHCAFVMRKSQVAPLKRVTILWLELTAAVCSIRISQHIHRELEYRIDENFFWTDSNVLLGYLNNESKRFHMYVASRVQEIQDSTDKKQWHYIESQLNPRIRHCMKWEPRTSRFKMGSRTGVPMEPGLYLAE